MLSNLDVSIGDTERWVGCLQRQCNQNILSAAKPAQRSVSQILTSEFDSIAPYFVTFTKYQNHHIFRGQSPNAIMTQQPLLWALNLFFSGVIAQHHILSHLLNIKINTFLGDILPNMTQQPRLWALNLSFLWGVLEPGLRPGQVPKIVPQCFQN